MMYFLFRHHHIMPMQYEEMGPGEKAVVRAFMHYQIEEHNKAVKEAG